MSIFNPFKPAPLPAPSPPAWQLVGSFDGKSVVVGAGPNYGGAVYSLLWGSQQLINQDPPNGGQMQTAYYVETPPGFTNAINPTEAGNYLDHVSSKGSPTGSTTIVVGEYLGSDHLQTICHPAYWSGAYQGSLTSPDALGKTVTLTENIIRLQYTLQFNSVHPSCAIETCWYMPLNFATWVDSLTGEQLFTPAKTSQNSYHTVIGSTSDGSFACAIYSMAPNKVFGWGFDQQYPKLNIYFPNLGVIANGQFFDWELFAVFGTLAQVRSTLGGL